MLVWISGANANQPVSPIPYVDVEGNEYPPNMEQLWTADQLSAINMKSTPVPPVYTAHVWQIKSVLTPTQTAAVTAAIAASPAANMLQAFWSTGDVPVPSNSATLIALGAAIGMTPDQVTALVQAANQVSIP